MDTRVAASVTMTVGPFLIVLAVKVNGWRWRMDGGGNDEWSQWRQCVAAAAAAAEEDEGGDDVWWIMCGGGYSVEWPGRQLMAAAAAVGVGGIS